MINTLKFSHFYKKMPINALHDPSILIQMFVCEHRQISRYFINYDTLYLDEHKQYKYYDIPNERHIVLLINTIGAIGIGKIWTTIRRWTHEDELYYKSIVGEELNIQVNKNYQG